MGKFYGYCRVSTATQNEEQQELTLRRYAAHEKIELEKITCETISGKSDVKKRELYQLLKILVAGDYIITPELSRLGRSIGQVTITIDGLMKRQIGLITLKENIHIPANGEEMNMGTKVQVTMFSLFADIERQLISERTKEGLKAAKAKGVKLGRQKGQKVKCRLDGNKDFVKECLLYGIPVTKIIKRLADEKQIKISRTAFDRYVKTRNLKPKKKEICN